ncbi:MAG: efflux RND transporter permease subunit [Gemmatimonadota bacterium]|nr:efflux RND transporter permease subunit [Gemmatimonadota bacterium]
MTDRQNVKNTPEGEAKGGGSFRNFRLTTFAVNHPTSALVLLAIIGIVGMLSYLNIPKESRPEILIPIVAVSTAYPGVSPNDVETLVTRKIEEEVNTIPEIKELTSTSVEGYSSVVAEFNTGMDMEEALRKVREKVDRARPELPADVKEPTVMEFNLSEIPILQVNVSGEYGLVLLKDVAEDLKERLEQIPSVSEVQISGGLEREVRIEVDLARMKHYNLAWKDLVETIQNENVTIPGGVIDVGNLKYPVRVAGEFQDTRLIEDLVVATPNGQPVYVRDVAAVDFGFKEQASYARLDGNPVVTLGIIKRSGENIIATADAVKAAIAEMQPGFPPSTVIKITSDESQDIHEMVMSLENNIISGLILVLAVLLFFLGLRNAGFVAISIPMSMLLSFIVMRALGISMNMVVLFALILALGMLVDNAIVVVENIYRHLEEGFGRVEAAIRATGEVAMPVIASTITTLGAFLPLLFWPGIAGEFMGYLPKTLIITLSSSLFVALVLVPVLCALFMRLDGTPGKPLTRPARLVLLGVGVLFFLAVAASNVIAAVMLAGTALVLVLLHRFVLTRVAHWFQNRAVPFMLNRYERRLRWALDHRLLMLGAAIVVLISSFFAFGALNSGVEYFPESIPPSQVFVKVDVPDGTSPQFTNQVTERIEQQLGGIEGMKDSESVVATVGGGGQWSGLFGSGGDGTVTVSFKNFEDREGDVFATLAEMQRELGDGIAGAEFKVEQPNMGPSSGKPVNLEIIGSDPLVLRQLASQAVTTLRAAPVGARIEGLESDMDNGRPELVVEVDREKAALYGLSTAQVGNTVRSAIQGVEAAKYRTGNDEYDIIVRLAEPYRQDLSALADLTVMHEGKPVPLNSVARWYMAEGYGSIKRKDMDRVATVSSDVSAGLNSNAVLAEVQQTLTDFQQALPAGYTMRYTGQQQEQEEAMEFLTGAFLVALMLIAFVLVSQFNSVVKPFIILTSVIMSTVGVLLGLILFQMPFGIIMTGVGIISLAGIVVNNAIVLIDYIDLLRERDGLTRREAIVQAGVTRFRPVVLTAVTTVLGLVPLAIGLNIDFVGLFTALSPNLYWGGEQAAWWGSMAIAVIAGLSFATVLTLVLVPVMYSLIDDFSAFFTRHFTQPDEPQEGKGGPGEPQEELEPAVGPVGEKPKVRVPALARLRGIWPRLAGG